MQLHVDGPRAEPLLVAAQQRPGLLIPSRLRQPREGPVAAPGQQDQPGGVVGQAGGVEPRRPPVGGVGQGDSEQERLASFGRALLPHLQPNRDGGAIHLGDDVELAYYRLQRVSSGAIGVGEEDAYVTSPTAVGTCNPEEERAPLSEIIERLNERFGTEFTEE